MFRYLLLLALSSPLYAADREILRGSVVEIRPTDQPNAVAEIVFLNRSVNSQLDEYSFNLEHEGISATIRFDWNVNSNGDDAIYVEVPPEYIAIPPELILREESADTLLIYPKHFLGY